MKVKDCMCDSVVWLTPETSVCDCAKLMCEQHIGSIPVCDKNQNVVGLVTDRDILLRTVACNKDIHTTKLSDIMTTNVCTCKKDDEMSNAESKMANNQIRRLPVCDENNHVIGILTLGDLAQNDVQLGTQQVCDTISDICDCNTNKNNQ